MILSYGKKYIESSEAAKMMGITSSAFSTKAKRNNYYGAEIIKLNATTLYKYDDLKKWMKDNKIDVKVEPKFDFKEGVKKTIGIMGRSGVGKDFVLQYMMTSPSFYKDIFTGFGSDTTKSRVEINFNLVTVQPKLTFYFDEDSAENILEDEDKKELKKMNGESIPFVEDEEKMVKDKVKKFNRLQDKILKKAIKNYDTAKGMVEKYEELIKLAESENTDNIFNKKIDDLQEKLEKEQKSLSKKEKTLDNIIAKNYLHIESPFSNFVIELAQNRFDELLIYNTVGVSGDYVVDNKLVDVDVMLLGFYDANEQEYTKSLKKMKGILASRNVLFVPRINKSVKNEDDYIKLQDEGINLLKQKKLNILQDGAILNTDLSVLNPKDNMVLMPHIEDNKSGKIFSNSLMESLKSRLDSNSQDNMKYLKEILTEKDYKSFTLEILNSLNRFLLKDFRDKDNSFQLEKHFIEEKTDRVKTNDKELTVRTLRFKKRQYLDKVLKEFEKYTEDNLSERKEDPKIIKSLYRLLNSYINNNYLSVGHGSHPAEDNPCTTMATIESLIANKLVRSEVLDATTDNLKESSKEYRKIFQENHINSRSWGYVKYKRPKLYRKLEIIDKYLFNENYNIENYGDAISLYYIMGLILYAEYNIFQKDKKLKDFDNLSKDLGLINSLT